MKISKLFHWLYAVLMFLPLLVFLPTGFYYAFNDNAQAQEYTKEEPNYYESNEVTSVADLVQGRVYTWNGGFFGESVSSYTQYFSFNALSGLSVTGENVLYRAYQQNNTIGIWAQYPNNGTTAYINITNLSFDFKLLGNESTIPNSVISCISICDTPYKDGTYNEITYTMGIVDSMVNAWNHTWELPLFSWSQDTFLNQPFNYITSLFSIPNGSTFANAFGYWLSLSICWLVFDVIMYVPLLVHRWIDKARIE